MTGAGESQQHLTGLPISSFCHDWHASSTTTRAGPPEGDPAPRRTWQRQKRQVRTFLKPVPWTTQVATGHLPAVNADTP